MYAYIIIFATHKACKQLYNYINIDRQLQKKQIVLNARGQRWSLGTHVPLVSIHPLSMALLWQREEAEAAAVEGPGRTVLGER